MTPEQKFGAGLVALVGEEELIAMMERNAKPTFTYGEAWLKLVNTLYWIEWQAEKGKGR